MKTAKELAEIFLEALDLYKDVDKSLKIEALANLLKEQDKITRHACADAVLSQCDIKCKNVGYDMVNMGSDHIDIDDATAVIMNTKAV